MLLKQYINQQLRYNYYFYQRLKAVQKQEQWSEQQLKEEQNRKFINLLRRAYKHSPFYRKFYQEHAVHIGQIQTVDDAPQLPVLTKKELRDHCDEIFIGSKFNRVSAYTSGTTGKPTQVYRNYQSTIEEGAYQWAYRMKLGHTPGMKTVVLRGNLRRDCKEKYDPFTKTLELSSYHLSQKNARWYYDKISKFRPNAILAYPSSVESLANLFRSLNTCFEIPLVFTSSETLYGHQRNKIEASFNCKIADWYGNAERTIALQQKEDGNYENLPLYSFETFYDDYLLSTGLTNNCFPLINYRVDDIIKPMVKRTKSCRYTVSHIQGRSDDKLILRDGTQIGLLWGAFDRVPNLCKAQIVQYRPECFEVNIVPGDKFRAEDESFLNQKLREFVGDDAVFSIHKVADSKIIRSKAGKYKLVVNYFLKKHTQQMLHTKSATPLS